MPFWSKLWSSPEERALLELYVPLLSSLGMSKGEATKQVKAAIDSCRQAGEREGTINLSGTFGSEVLELAKIGQNPAAEIVSVAKSDGATDLDIQSWWSLADVSRRMMWWSESSFRYANFSAFVEQGDSEDKAMLKVRRMFPMYGDPRDTQHVTGDDRPLANELRGRVDRFRENHGAERIIEWSSGYSTLNAYVRSCIRAGRL
jgi:hypothetical protein